MASELVTDLGRQYVNTYFHQSMFKIDNDVFIFQSIQQDGNSVVVSKMPDNERSRWTTTELPIDLLKDFTTFSIPRLGYRNIGRNSMSAVVNLSAMRSTRRGFKLDHLLLNYAPVYGTVGTRPDDLWDTYNQTQRAKVIYFPEFLTLKDGMKELLGGQRAGFALSPDAAIEMDIDSEAEFPWCVRFKGKAIGGVDDSGKIVIRNKVVSRSSLYKLLELN